MLLSHVISVYSLISPVTQGKLVTQRENTTMLVMTKNKKKVVIHIEVEESTRTRLRMEAVRRGITMGQLLGEIVDKTIPPVELHD